MLRLTHHIRYFPVQVKTTTNPSSHFHRISTYKVFNVKNSLYIRLNVKNTKLKQYLMRRKTLRGIKTKLYKMYEGWLDAKK